MSIDPTNDTDPRIEKILVEGYRRMSPTQKLQIVSELTQAVQAMALVDVRRRYPAATEREQALRVASRWLEPDIMVSVFGWDARIQGY